MGTSKVYRCCVTLGKPSIYDISAGEGIPYESYYVAHLKVIAIGAPSSLETSVASMEGPSE